MCFVSKKTTFELHQDLSVEVMMPCWFPYRNHRLICYQCTRSTSRSLRNSDLRTLEPKCLPFVRCHDRTTLPTCDPPHLLDGWDPWRVRHRSVNPDIQGNRKTARIEVHRNRHQLPLGYVDDISRCRVMERVQAQAWTTSTGGPATDWRSEGVYGVYKRACNRGHHARRSTFQTV